MTMERLTIVDFIARLPLDPIFISGSRRNFVSHTCSRHAANISARTNTQLIRRSPIPENQCPRKMSRQGDEALAFRGLGKIINGEVRALDGAVSVAGIFLRAHPPCAFKSRSESLRNDV